MGNKKVHPSDKRRTTFKVQRSGTNKLKTEVQAGKPATLAAGNHYFFCQQYGSRQISEDVCIVRQTRSPEGCKGCERKGGAA